MESRAAKAQASQLLNETRKGLERELDTETFRGLFRAFARRSAHARRFKDWSELISHLHGRADPQEIEDAILRDLFDCHAEDKGPLWRTVLTLVFFPALSSIFANRRQWRTRQEDLWSDLYWAFTQIVTRIDLSSRPAEIAKKVYDDTLHRLRLLCEKEWKHAERERILREDAFAAVEPHAFEPGFLAVERREEARRLLGQMRALCAEGVLSEDDLALVLETRLFGVTLEDAAHRRGTTYQAVKKRRQRAEATIRRRAREPRKRISETLSPALDSPPLKPPEREKAEGKR